METSDVAREDFPGKLEARSLTSQSGSYRGAWSGDPVLRWKLNLVALSQREDLYFVALHETVYVDRPNVSADPMFNDMVCDFRWMLPRSAAADTASEHHSPRYPHGVNHLIVDELGDEEVLVCACDDGDVLVYRVSSISLAFEAMDEGLPQKTALDRYMKPLYHYNVGKSAWGLAVQKEAYLIATSSNLAEISVLEAGLCHLETPQAFEVLKIYREGVEADRSVTQISRLAGGHETNIPDVRFYRTRDQDSTIYLFSSDIDNNVVIWNITCDFQMVCRIKVEHDITNRQTGWLAFPVGPEIFRIVDDPDHIHGSAPELNCADACADASSFVPLAVTSNEKTEQPSRPLSADFANDVCKLPSFLHVSTSYITFSHSFGARSSARVLGGLWRRAPPPFVDQLGSTGTMRYARLIPELGIAVIGSHLGHVGIFTLTRLNGDDQTNPQLGMRLDQILPFEEQVPEANRLAGFSGWGALIGIATAPIPGSVKGRYRLVLEYSSRTLLSYELWRDAART